MRRTVLVMGMVGAILAAASGAAQAKSPKRPLGSDAFSVFRQTPVPMTVPATFPDVWRSVETFGGPVFVAPRGLQVCLGMGDTAGFGYSCGALDKAREGRLVVSMVADGPPQAPVARVLQLVPDGIPAIVVAGKVWPVTANVGMALVTRGQASRYGQRAATARGKRVYGFMNER